MVLEESDITALRPARLVPGGALARFVAEILVIVRGPNRSEHLGLPHVHADLIFRLFGDGGSPYQPQPTGGDLHAVGTLRRAFRVSVTDAPAAVVVRFRPGAAHLMFCVAMRELADRVVPIEDLWGSNGRELHDRLLEKPDTGAWLKVVGEHLEARVRKLDAVQPPSARAAALAVRSIARPPTSPSVTAVAGELGLSERQLRRIFDDAVGIGPKAFARVVRFHRALRSAEQAEAVDWADLAVGAGYYDQAHLIGEFQRFTNMSPVAFLRDWKRAGTERDNPL